MTLYDILCLILCIFAVFGGYAALRTAAHAALRRSYRNDDGEKPDCGGCPTARRCPSNSPRDDEEAAESRPKSVDMPDEL